MIWIILNIVLLVLGSIFIIASQFLGTVNACTPVPEDIFDMVEVLLGCAGAVCLAFLMVSEPLRWWLG